ncbi:hypothetical protein BJV82DRAFT_703682 [Fennellomyces sp. T-0311]|nr:hypothetical protein BJV82DRAFT_703682 [Fennellomyces sp. T-0311]
MIYGANKTSSTAVILHMSRLPPVTDRIAILQIKFLIRAHNLPTDALLTAMLPRMTRTRSRSWEALKSLNLIWSNLTRPQKEATDKEVREVIREYQQNQHQIRCSRWNTKLLNSCRTQLGIDPILWLPMSPAERMTCIRYRLGWLPSGKPAPCPRCCHFPGMNRHHIIE